MSKDIVVTGIFRDGDVGNNIPSISINIDTDIIRSLIRTMNSRSPMYKLLKEELSPLGYWKNKPRGKPGFHKKE